MSPPLLSVEHLDVVYDGTISALSDVSLPKAYWDQINADDGVCGPDVTVDVQDHGYDPQKAVALQWTGRSRRPGGWSTSRTSASAPGRSPSPRMACPRRSRRCGWS